MTEPESTGRDAQDLDATEAREQQAPRPRRRRRPPVSADGTREQPVARRRPAPEGSASEAEPRRRRPQPRPAADATDDTAQISSADVTQQPDRRRTRRPVQTDAERAKQRAAAAKRRRSAPAHAAPDTSAEQAQTDVELDAQERRTREDARGESAPRRRRKAPAGTTQGDAARRRTRPTSEARATPAQAPRGDEASAPRVRAGGIEVLDEDRIQDAHPKQRRTDGTAPKRRRPADGTAPKRRRAPERAPQQEAAEVAEEQAAPAEPKVPFWRRRPELRPQRDAQPAENEWLDSEWADDVRPEEAPEAEFEPLADEQVAEPRRRGESRARRRGQRPRPEGAAREQQPPQERGARRGRRVRPVARDERAQDVTPAKIEQPAPEPVVEEAAASVPPARRRRRRRRVRPGAPRPEVQATPAEDLTLDEARAAAQDVSRTSEPAQYAEPAVVAADAWAADQKAATEAWPTSEPAPQATWEQEQPQASEPYELEPEVTVEDVASEPLAEPAFTEPAYEEPHAEEPYPEPAYSEPAYQEPAYEEPYEEPAYGEPIEAEGEQSDDSYGRYVGRTSFYTEVDEIVDTYDDDFVDPFATAEFEVMDPQEGEPVRKKGRAARARRRGRRRDRDAQAQEGTRPAVFGWQRGTRPQSQTFEDEQRELEEARERNLAWERAVDEAGTESVEDTQRGPLPWETHDVETAPQTGAEPVGEDAVVVPPFLESRGQDVEAPSAEPVAGEEAEVPAPEEPYEETTASSSLWTEVPDLDVTPVSWDRFDFLERRPDDEQLVRKPRYDELAFEQERRALEAERAATEDVEPEGDETPAEVQTYDYMREQEPADASFEEAPEVVEEAQQASDVFSDAQADVAGLVWDEPAQEAPFYQGEPDYQAEPAYQEESAYVAPEEDYVEPTQAAELVAAAAVVGAIAEGVREELVEDERTAQDLTWDEPDETMVPTSEIEPTESEAVWDGEGLSDDIQEQAEGQGPETDVEPAEVTYAAEDAYPEDEGEAGYAEGVEEDYDETAYAEDADGAEAPIEAEAEDLEGEQSPYEDATDEYDDYVFEDDEYDYGDYDDFDKPIEDDEYDDYGDYDDYDADGVADEEASDGFTFPQKRPVPWASSWQGRELKQTAGKRRSPAFWILYAILVATLAVGVGLVWHYTYDSLVRYENSQATSFLEGLIDGLQAGGTAAEAKKQELFSSVELAPHESVELLGARFDRGIGAQGYRLQQETTSVDADSPVYTIYLGDEAYLTLAMHATASYVRLGLLSITDWEVTDFILYPAGVATPTPELLGSGMSYEVSVAENSTVVLNGQQLTDADLSEGATVLAGFEYAAQFVDPPEAVTYAVSGLRTEPEVSATDFEGRPVDLIRAGNTFSAASLSVPNREASELPVDVLNIAETWSKLMTQDLGGADYSYGVGEVNRFLIPGSELFEFANNFVNSVDITFVVGHSIDSFTEESVTNCVMYNDRLFSCDVHFVKNMTLYSTGVTRNDVFNNTMIFAYVDELGVVSQPGWYLVNMQAL